MENKIEIWKDVIGYEFSYQVSSFGRVKSLERIIKRNSVFGDKKNKEKIIKPSITNGNYYRLNLKKTNNTKSFSIHRLVALHFIPNPENKPQVNHKDGDKLNNNYTNLEWVTSKENIKHAILNGLFTNKKGIEHNKSKLNEKQVLEIRQNKIDKLKDLSLKYNISISVISKIKKNQLWKHI